MKKHSLFIITFLFVFVLNCSNHESTRDYIITERNLIPEGTAIDNRTGIIYIGSTFKRKIIQITPEGEVTDFIPQQLDNIWSIVGVEVDEDRGVLWANTAHANEAMPLINPDTANDWMTNVSAFDIQQKKIIKKYELKGKAFLNDLTVLPNGDVFITETINSKIYKIDAKENKLEFFLEPKGFTFLNGITYAKAYNSLFVSSNEGIVKLDVTTGSFQLIEPLDKINTKNIDGLAFYNNILIGHQSSKVSKFYLNNEGSKIVKSEILDSGNEFDSSTTGEVSSKYYYFIVNSQIRSGIDQNNGTIKPIDRLNNIIIRKLKL